MQHLSSHCNAMLMFVSEEIVHVAVASSIGRPLLYTYTPHTSCLSRLNVFDTAVPYFSFPFSYIGEVWSYKKVCDSQALLQFPAQKFPPGTPPPDPDLALASPPMSPPGLNRLAAHNLSIFATEMLTQTLRSRSPSPERGPLTCVVQKESAEPKPSWP
jgi:hypothetical protein